MAEISQAESLKYFLQLKYFHQLTFFLFFFQTILSPPTMSDPVDKTELNAEVHSVPGDHDGLREVIREEE